MAVIKHLRWLSLHIALGAISVLYLVDNLQQLHLSVPVYVCLFTAVWSIYLWDHRQDSSTEDLQNPRRQFHRKMRKWLTSLIVINVTAGFISASFLDGKLLLAGVGCGALCTLYLLRTRDLGQRNLKELLCALFYALGIFLAPMVYGDFWVNLAMALQLMAIAFANLVLFSVYEREMDEREGFSSIVTNIGLEDSRNILRITLIGLLISCLLFGWVTPWRFQLFVLVSTLTLGLIAQREGHFQQEERYRIYGDLVFLLPLFLG